jgi:hypothetical protein
MTRRADKQLKPRPRTEVSFARGLQGCVPSQGCIFHPFLFSPINPTGSPVPAPRAAHSFPRLEMGVYYLDKCIFHPVMFSPRQTGIGGYTH